MSRHPVVRQRDATDCGPAALLSALRYWGGDAGLGRVRALASTDAGGTTLLGLLRAAEALGFEARGARGETGDLAKERLPALAHVHVEGRPHFVTVYRIHRGHVEVMDPAVGRRRLSVAAFEAIWVTRTALLLRPTDELVRSPQPHWVRWIAGYFRREVAWVVQAVLMGAAYTVLGLLTAFFVRALLDRFIPAGDVRAVVTLGGMLLALHVLRAGVGFLRHRFLLELQRRVSTAVAADSLGHLFQLPASFFALRTRGDITARLHDAVRVHAAMVRLLGGAAVDVMVVAGSLVVLFAIAPPIGWMGLAAVPIYGALLAAFTHRVREAQSDVMAGYARVESAYIDTLDAVHTIRAFNASAAFASFVSGLHRRFQDRVAALERVQAGIGLHAENAASVIAIGALTGGAALIVAGALTVGQLMAAYTVLAGALPAIARTVDAHVSVQEAAVAAGRLMDVLQVDRESNGGPRPFRLRRTLALHNVSFAWLRGEPVLDGVTIEIRPGRITALAGPSGAGKSTAVQLLERRYTPTAGGVFVDDTPASDIDLREYRRRVATLPESVPIINATVADNVLLGRSVAEPAGLIERRAQEIGLEEFLARFPDGLRTPLGEGGRRISSGERQLLGLLRAMLHEPAVLLVDEGISTIDAAAVRTVLDVLHRYARRHTVLVVSHHLRTLAAADYVYVLERGRVTDQGTPRELLARPSPFHDLFAPRSAVGVPA